ncbi:MAG: GYD domain-containing protein [Candidatus Dormibacteraeota bacterium]|nr:GYD domain-containing protein [Candidatus Dormibacteraeota bacterium]
MEFVTLVQIRPRANSNAARVPDEEASEWQQLERQITLLGGRVQQIFNVLGNEYDLLILGEAKDPKTLHRIDAICKREGYPAKTHPAIPADEYAQLVEETNAILNNRLPRRRSRNQQREA